MGTDWSTTAELGSSDGQQWSSKITSSTSTEDFKIAAEAPEDIHLTFEELDIIPEEIQGDNFYEDFSTWVRVDSDSAKGLGGWATVYSGGTTETEDDGITR